MDKRGIGGVTPATAVKAPVGHPASQLGSGREALASSLQSRPWRSRHPPQHVRVLSAVVVRVARKPSARCAGARARGFARRFDGGTPPVAGRRARCGVHTHTYRPPPPPCSSTRTGRRGTAERLRPWEERGLVDGARSWPRSEADPSSSSAFTQPPARSPDPRARLPLRCRAPQKKKNVRAVTCGSPAPPAAAVPEFPPAPPGPRVYSLTASCRAAVKSNPAPWRPRHNRPTPRPFPGAAIRESGRVLRTRVGAASARAILHVARSRGRRITPRMS